jgi:hypothetical protein
MKATHRIILEDKGQDLLTIDVSLSDTGIGTIIGTNAAVSKAQNVLYHNKAFDLHENHVGKVFNYADPSDGFRRRFTRFTIEQIEELKTSE